MNGPAPRSTAAAHRSQGRPSPAGQGSSIASAVSTPPTSISRYPQPIQPGEVKAVTPPWSATCAAATPSASRTPTIRIPASGAAPALALAGPARPVIVCCAIVILLIRSPPAGALPRSNYGPGAAGDWPADG